MAVECKKPSTWAHYVALLKKDLSQELHTKDMITSGNTGVRSPKRTRWPS